MESARIALDDGASVGRSLHRARHLFTDLECPNTDVRADGHDELAWVVSKRTDRLRHDVRHRPPPTYVHGSNVSAPRMRDENRCTIRRPGCYPNPFQACN